ncbi:MAG: hypothetical protein ABEL76_08045 [Bradymonadaceae bacterium]
MGSSPNRFVWMLAAAAGLALGVYACTDSMSRKKGAPGEFCNGSDTQCREGLICDEGVCSYQNNARKVCQSVCDKFNRTCNAGVDKCLASCVETLTQCWASEVTQKYASCYNSEQMTCERIESTDKPYNLCYQQLELPQRRLQTCRRLLPSVGHRGHHARHRHAVERLPTDGANGAGHLLEPRVELRQRRRERVVRRDVPVRKRRLLPARRRQAADDPAEQLRWGWWWRRRRWRRRRWRRGRQPCPSPPER